MRIGDKIRYARTKAELTSTELAAKLGISTAYLSQLEHNRRNPGREVVFSLAKVLNVPAEFFSEEAEPLEYPNQFLNKEFSPTEHVERTYTKPEVPNAVNKMKNLVDYVVPINRAKQSNITPDELNELIEAYEKLKEMEEQNKK